MKQKIFRCYIIIFSESLDFCIGHKELGMQLQPKTESSNKNGKTFGLPSKKLEKNLKLKFKIKLKIKV